MSKSHGGKRVSKASKHYVNGWWYTDYEIGHVLYQCRKPLPITAPRAMQQGYVNAAKEQDLSMIASMRHAERQGRFQFLPKHSQLSWQSGNALNYGQKSRYPVTRARAQQRRALVSQGQEVA